MKPGQTRVLVLLTILLGLEALRMPGLRGFFKGAYAQANTTLSSQGGQK